MSEIMVRGEVRRRVGPTEATVHVSVRATHSRRLDAAIDEGGRRCAAVDAIIDGLRESLVRTATTSSLRTGKEYEHTSKGRQHVGYMATRSTSVACAPDGAGLTALMDSLSRLEGVTLSGPTWTIAPDAEGMRQVRADAAADARERAEDYARGLGQSVGRLLWMSEPGLRLAGGSGSGGGGPRADIAGSPAAPGAVGAMSRSLRGGGGDAGDDEQRPVTIEVEPLNVHVRVEAAFSLSED